MNLWWDVFDVSSDALGGWTANLPRLASVVLAILLTVNRGRIRGPLSLTADATRVRPRKPNNER